MTPDDRLQLYQKFSIYCAEIYNDDYTDASHSALYLVNGLPDEKGKHRILERIHFDAGTRYIPEERATVNLLSEYSGMVRKKFLETARGKFAGVVSGDRDDMLALWKKGREVARRIEKLQLRMHFGKNPTFNNCRSGVIAVLKKLGLEFVPINKSERGQSGTRAGIEYLPELADIPVSEYGVPTVG